MEKIIDISNRAVADYGFRQAVLYGLVDIVAKWSLTDEEAAVLSGPVLDELSALPVPVKPAVIVSVQSRLEEIIRGLSS